MTRHARLRGFVGRRIGDPYAADDVAQLGGAQRLRCSPQRQVVAAAAAVHDEVPALDPRALAFT